MDKALSWLEMIAVVGMILTLEVGQRGHAAFGANVSQDEWVALMITAFAGFMAIGIWARKRHRATEQNF